MISKKWRDKNTPFLCPQSLLRLSPPPFFPLLLLPPSLPPPVPFSSSPVSEVSELALQVSASH